MIYSRRPEGVAAPRSGVQVRLDLLRVREKVFSEVLDWIVGHDLAYFNKTLAQRGNDVGHEVLAQWHRLCLEEQRLALGDLPQPPCFFLRGAFSFGILTMALVLLCSC